MFSKRLKGLKPYKTETTPAKVRLSSNELPYDLPDELKEKIAREVKKINLSLYPDPEAGELREAIGEFWGVDPKNIVLGNGSDELIYYLSVVVGEFSEGVYIPVPTFPMYEIASRVFGRPVYTVPLGKNFDIDLPESLRVISSEKVSLAFFSYPNNPTGNLFSREAIEKIRDHSVVVVVDEAYYSYSGETFLEDSLKRSDTVVLRTLSKIGLAGLRVGVLIATEEVVREINKVRLPFNITLPSQVIARTVLREGKEFIASCVEKVIAERERLLKELSNLKGIEVFPSKANFILIRSKDVDLYRELLKRGILVRDMSHLPLLEGCVRVTVGKPEENDMFLETLDEVLKCHA